MAKITSKQFDDRTITITRQKAVAILRKQGDGLKDLERNGEIGIQGTGCKIKWQDFNNKFYIRTYGCPLEC